jgi:hypothetical protein
MTIEQNDNNLPQIERAIQGKKSGRTNMIVPPHIRLAAVVEENQAAASLAAWRLEREKELEMQLQKLDAELATFKK